MKQKCPAPNIALTDLNMPNRNLKEIRNLAELDEQVIITKTIGDRLQNIIKHKWELLTSHVGRRSLISNCIL